MDFVLIRGQNFSEEFNFKDAEGRSISLPNGKFRLILEHGSFAREYTVGVGTGLSRTRSSIQWKISKEETARFAYNVLYYTLYLDNQELARGILRVQ